MELKNLTLKVINKVAHLSINRPEKANSMTEDAWNELKKALVYLFHVLCRKKFILKRDIKF